jgi:hypothetical protein
MRTGIFIGALLTLALAPIARADGLPVADSGAPAIVAGNSGRYVALPARHGTVVAHLGQTVYQSRFLEGRFTLPVVAFDGTASGVAVDGSTVVLISPRRSFPRTRTTFAILNAHNLSLRSKIVLPGDYSFDALSPDGTRMYLIHYVSPRNPTRYEVRAYDLTNDRLVPNAIVDKTEPDERMAGYPITRTTSADGRFAYTLYDGGGKAPFIHALDTVKGEARCIDLDMLAGNQNLYALRVVLSGNGASLAVTDRGRQVTAIDTRTYLPVGSTAAPKEAGSNWPRVLTVSILILVGLGGVLFGRRRLGQESQRSSRPSAPRT